MSSSVSFITITEEQTGQRIDNFLITYLKGAPKSLIYRILRKGEIRVNKKRVKPEYKLNLNDILRIPPVKLEEKQPSVDLSGLNKVNDLNNVILYEDDFILVINKPSGMAVHGGSGLSFGVIEGLRAIRPESRFLELVHRLDRETSGVLLIAKKRSALRALHEQLRLKQMKKEYLALVRGNWDANTKSVSAPLQKNILKSGERVVTVDSEGKQSETLFKVEQRFDKATLIKATPITGRTHQIRVHCLHAGHPIACDSRYGDKDFDLLITDTKLKRLFLHAYSLTFIHPDNEQTMRVEAPLDNQLRRALDILRGTIDYSTK